MCIRDSIYNNPTRNQGAIVKAMIYSCDRFYKPKKSKRILRRNQTSQPANRKSFLWDSDWRKSVALSEYISDDEEASIGESCSYETYSEPDVFLSSSSLFSKPEPPHKPLYYTNYEHAALSYTPVSIVIDVLAVHVVILFAWFLLCSFRFLHDLYNTYFINC